jgi:hypothetical protein
MDYTTHTLSEHFDAHCVNTAITAVVGECNCQFCNASDVTVLVLSMNAVMLQCLHDCTIKSAFLCTSVVSKLVEVNAQVAADVDSILFNTHTNACAHCIT